MGKVSYQVTLKCATGQYKPVSTLITRAQENDEIDLLQDEIERKKIQNEGIIDICIKRTWNKKDLQNYHYTTIVMRKYDIKKIQEKKKLRYEKLKQEKYARGEWQPNKRELRQERLKELRKVKEEKS